MTILGRHSFWNRLASYFLIVSSAGHFVGHYISYEDESRFSPQRLELARRMQAHVAEGPLPISTWTMLQMFSLSFGLLLFLGGLSSLMLIRNDQSISLVARHLKFNTIFWAVSCIVFLLHPVIQPLVICTTAALFYGCALWRTKSAKIP